MSVNWKALPPNLFKSSFLLVLITALAAFLRFYALGFESYWLDETASAMWSAGSLAAILQECAGDVHPPLYFILLKFWGEVFGRSDWALRAFSALCGTLAVPVVYFTAQELFKRSSAALAAALLLAVSQFHVQFSQEARSYAMMCFGAVLSTLFFLRLLKTPSFKNVFFYFLAAVLLLYTHLFGAFFIIAHTVFFLLFKNDCKVSFKKWAAIQFTLFITFLPWMFVIRGQMAAHKEFWILPLQISSLPQLLLNFSGSLTVWGVIALVIFCGLIAFALWRKKGSFKSDPAFSLKSDPAFSLVVLWFFVPVILALLVSVLLQPVFMPRFLIGTLPAFLLISAYGIDLLKTKSFKTFAIAILTICSLINCAILLHEINKERWREAVHFTENLLKEGDTIIFHAGFTGGTYERYAFKKGIEKIPFPRAGNDITAPELSDLRSVVRDKKHIALVLSHSRDEHGDIVKVLKEQFAEKHHRVYAHRSAGSHKEVVGVEVWVFEK